MNNFNQDHSIDLSQELQKMIHHTLATWNGNQDDIVSIISQSFNVGYDAAHLWVDDYSTILSELSKQWSKDRQSIISSDLTQFDDVSKIAANLLLNSSPLKNFVIRDWNYLVVLDDLIDLLQPSISDKKIFPKGWSSPFKYNGKKSKSNLIQNISSFNSEQPNFYETVSLASTYYQYTEQQRSPFFTLVSASFSHGLFVRQHNNTIDVFLQAKKLQEYFSQKEFNKPTFIPHLTHLSNNPLFNALMIDKYSNGIERPYSSQEELDFYIQQYNDNTNIYGLITLSFPFDNNSQYVKNIIHQIYSLEHFQTTIDKNIQKLFENSDINTLSFFDNITFNFTKEQLKSSLKIQQISQKDLSKYSHVSSVISDDYSFLNYSFPSVSELIEMNANRLKNLLKTSKKTSNLEFQEEIIPIDKSEKNYYQSLKNILELNSKKNKIK